VVWAKRKPLEVWRWIPAALLTALVFTSTSSVATTHKRDDVVVLDNGDRLTGEVKGMNQGQLVLDTAHLGTLNIPWVHIHQITGAAEFEIVLADGDMVLGSIEPSSKTGMIAVLGREKRTELHKEQVVRVVPIKKRFWGRFDGGVNLGYSYTKSSEVAQFSLNADVIARTEHQMTNLALNTIFTAQQVAENSTRLALAGAHTRFLEHNWFVEGQAGVIHNEELGLDLEVLLGGGGGRFLKRTNRNWVRVVGGLDIIREWPTGMYDPETNLEANISLDYILFKYSANNNYFRTGLTLFSGLTDWGRVRGNWNLHLNQTIVGNLSWSLNGYAGYDSDPVDPTAESEDWGLVLALGWTF